MPALQQRPAASPAAAGPETTSPAAAGPALGGPDTTAAAPGGGNAFAASLAAGASGGGAGGGGGPVAPVASGGKPAWGVDEITAIQTELKRLSLYTKRIDGVWGGGTRGGLMTAYGDESWLALSAGDVLTKLKGMGGGGGAAEPAGGGGGAAPAGGGPATWPKKDVIAVQTELKRIGLYTKTIDGVFGGGSDAGLVEAFGGDQWRTMPVADVLNQLKGAASKAAPADGKAFRYGEMFKDGVLDMTIGVGFDEGGNHIAAIEAFEDVLGGFGFSVDAGLAMKLYEQAGHGVGPSDFGKYFVKSNALTYKPPVGGERKVHAVVRLLFSMDGNDGGEARDGMSDGLANSDVAYYSGHGRYGSGPDFDRNMSFELKDDKGAVVRKIDDYEVLEHTLAEEGKAQGRSAWAQFEYRIKKGTLNVIGTNDGNVFLNPELMHGNEFGGKLMYWNLKRSGGQGAPVQTGKDGEIAKKNAASPEHKYNVQVYDGCRTRDYVKAVKATPGMGDKNADVLATRRTLNWGDEAKTLGQFLNGILNQQSAAGIVTNMDQQQSSDGKSGVGNAYDLY